jgi:hypothetical protein
MFNLLVCVHNNTRLPERLSQGASLSRDRAPHNTASVKSVKRRCNRGALHLWRRDAQRAKSEKRFGESNFFGLSRTPMRFVEKMLRQW